MGPLRPRQLACLTALFLACSTAPAAAMPSGPGEPLASPKRILVSMEWTGGITGVDDYLVVGTDGFGRVDRESGSTYLRLPARNVRKLRRALHAAAFVRLAPYYPADPPVADRFQYAVLYKGHYVRADDGARPPARFAHLLLLLRKLAGVTGPTGWSPAR